MQVNSINCSLYGSGYTGILSAGFIYDIPKNLKFGNKILFYKFHIEDVLEIEYTADNITIRDYPYTKLDYIQKIKQKAEFYSGYFDSAGLRGQKFLLDISTGLAVRKNDFIEKDKPFLGNERIGYLIHNDNKSDDYVTNTSTSSVLVIDSFYKYVALNNSIMALYNNHVEISKPKDTPNNFGCISTSIIAGLLSGVEITDQQKLYMAEELSTTINVFMTKIDSNFFKSNVPNEESKTLKTTKLLSSLYSAPENDEFSGESINLSRLIDLGLDKFMRGIKDANKKIGVNIDIVSGIKTMFIRNGACFVTLTRGMTTIDKVQEQLDSANVYEILN